MMLVERVVMRVNESFNGLLCRGHGYHRHLLRSIEKLEPYHLSIAFEQIDNVAFGDAVGDVGKMQSGARFENITAVLRSGFFVTMQRGMSEIFR